MSEESVIKGRDYWIGGSDIPAIMGKSTFSTPFDLLDGKVNYTPNDNDDTFMKKYTDFGNHMEPNIRDYINEAMECNYRPDVAMKVNERLRANVDGWDKDTSNGIKLLEIKTYGNTLRMEEYNLQVQLYMYVYDVDRCLLAMYKRTKSKELFSFDDFEMEFDPDNLTTEIIERDEDLITEILTRVDEFLKLMNIHKVNPLTVEQFNMKFMGSHELSIQLNELDKIMKMTDELKAIQHQEKEVKSNIRELMIANDVRTIETENYKVTAGKDTVSKSFDSKQFKKDYPELYDKYVKESIRKGSLTVTNKNNKK